MNIRLLLFLFLNFCFSLFVEAENELVKLVILSKDGTKVAYALAEKPKITFTETYLVINTKNVEVNYFLENVVRFTYEDNVSTPITHLQTDKLIFKLDGESLLFPSLKANSSIAVYSMNDLNIIYL